VLVVVAACILLLIDTQQRDTSYFVHIIINSKISVSTAISVHGFELRALLTLSEFYTLELVVD
jgi:hypothetical protein